MIAAITVNNEIFRWPKLSVETDIFLMLCEFKQSCKMQLWRFENICGRGGSCRRPSSGLVAAYVDGEHGGFAAVKSKEGGRPQTLSSACLSKQVRSKSEHRFTACMHHRFSTFPSHCSLLTLVPAQNFLPKLFASSPPNAGDNRLQL